MHHIISFHLPQRSSGSPVLPLGHEQSAFPVEESQMAPSPQGFGSQIPKNTLANMLKFVSIYTYDSITFQIYHAFQKYVTINDIFTIASIVLDLL